MTTGPARVLVVEHEEGCPPALLGGWLVEAGCALDVCRPYAGDPLPPVEEYDALLVLGGSMDAGDPTVPWLEPVRAAIRAAAAAGVPTLGVCLGHQLAALAFGGAVGRNPRGQQVGLLDLGTTDEAAADQLLGPLFALGVPAVFWNDDIVHELPSDAVVLARAATGELQAVRYAPGVWGVQWHPEVDSVILAAWALSDGDRIRARGIDQDAVLAAIDAARPQLAAAGRRLAASLSSLAHDRRQAR